ncbi:MAG: ATP-binding protein [Reinekea sp.]
MANPFHYESLPSSDNFCGRVQELNLMSQLIHDSKNIVLYGDRRYGKTSLIEHVFRALPDKFYTAFVDLFSCVDSQDVAVVIYKAVLEALPFNIERRLKEFSSVIKRARMEAQTTATGSIRFMPVVDDRDFNELIEDALMGAEALCEKNNARMVIALDEFQEVVKVKDKRVDAVFRSYMQRLSRVSFIFSGSRKSILSSLFVDRSAPLYGMATSVSVKGIELNILREYCEQRLGATFEADAFESLYQLSHGQTKLILQTCYWLYAYGDALNSESVQKCVKQIIMSKDAEFTMIFGAFSEADKKVLRMVVELGGINLYTAESQKLYNISKQRSYRAVNALIESGDVTVDENDSFQVADIDFLLWLKLKFQLELVSY